MHLAAPLLVLVPLAAALALDERGAEVAPLDSPREQPPGTDAPWAEVLGPSRAEWPAPQDQVIWRGDLAAAVEESEATGRPLFVTLRCLPCDQCSAFDRDVLEGGPELTPLLARFVTVRLVTMRDVDRALLPYVGFQDLDLSWWGYFLDGRVLLGIYGGRDEVSDATRISVPSLAKTLRRVLDFHYDPRRGAWDVTPPPPAPSWNLPEEAPGWGPWAARGAKEVDATECLHCHQVNEIVDHGSFGPDFDKRTDFWRWPFPENAGFALDRDDGLLVNAVAPGGAADAIGLGVGDRLGAAGGRLLFGQADLRGVLHRASTGNEPARVPLVWTRDGALRAGVLDLPAGWREVDLGWRKSVAEAGIGANIGFPWPLGVSGRDRRRLGIAEDALAVRAYFPKGPEGAAGEAGLRGHHVIVAVNGETPRVEGRAFLVWFRLRFEPGDEVRLTVLGDDGAAREVVYAAPEAVLH